MRTRILFTWLIAGLFYVGGVAGQTPISSPVVRDFSCTTATASGTTYACSAGVAPGSYVSNQQYMFVADITNTGAVTVNFNSLGPKAVTKVVGGITTVLVAGDIQAGQRVFLVYDGTEMQMTVPVGNAPQSSGSTITNYTINNSIIQNGACKNCTLGGTELTNIFPNAAVTGTTLNKLAKLTGVGTMVISSAGDTGGVIGICTGNTSTPGSSACGTTGSSEIAEYGTFSCIFDNATTADDYVTISASVAGDCHDNGASYPVGQQVLGRVLVTAAAGTRSMTLFGPESNFPAFVRSISVPSAGCNAAAGANAWDLPSSNAPAATCYGTSYRFGALDYDDAANETATFHFMLPTGWTGSIDFIAWAFVNATSQSVKLTVATKCIATSEDILNPTFNTAQTITVTSPGTANQAFNFSQTAITTTGCSAGEMMLIKVGRDTTDTSTATFSVTEAELAIRVTPQA